jgi:hypothetical protein
MQRGAFTTALNCSGRQHGIEKGRTKKGTSASRLRGQTAFLIMSACRLSGGAPYYPRDFGPSPERSLAAFVSVGPVLDAPSSTLCRRCSLRCSKRCSAARHVHRVPMVCTSVLTCHATSTCRHADASADLHPPRTLRARWPPLKRRGGMSSLLGRSGSGRPLSTYYFMRLLYYVRDASNSILCHYRMPHGISRKYLRPCLLAHLSLVWRPLFVEQHGAFSFELYTDSQSDSLGVAVRSHGHRDERGESGE